MRSPSSLGPISLTYSPPQTYNFKQSRRLFCIFWTILPCRLFSDLPRLCPLKTEGTHSKGPKPWSLFVHSLLWHPWPHGSLGDVSGKCSVDDSPVLICSLIWNRSSLGRWSGSVRLMLLFRKLFLTSQRQKTLNRKQF